jgi:tetratricopeptide (TPR) repeat protein
MDAAEIPSAVAVARARDERRWSRYLAVGGSIQRVEIASPTFAIPRRAWIVPIGAGAVSSVRQDAVVGGAGIYEVENWAEWFSGENETLVVRRYQDAKEERWAARRLGEFRPAAPARYGRARRRVTPEPVAPRRSPPVTPPRWPLRRAVVPGPVDALWVEDASIDPLLDAWRHRADVHWDEIRVITASGGLVLRGPLPPSSAFVAGTIGLASIAMPAGSEILVESGLEVPRTFPGSFPSGGPVLAIVHAGRVEITFIPEATHPLIALFAPRARTIPLDRLGSPASAGDESTDGEPIAGATEEGLHAENALRELALWWQPKTGIERETPRDETQSGIDATSIRASSRREGSSPQRHETRAARGWRRYLPLRRAWNLFRRGLRPRPSDTLPDTTEDGSAHDLPRSYVALSSLVARLSGEDWRQGIALALPLRAPRRGEPDRPWLGEELDLWATDTDFSVDRDPEVRPYAAIRVGRDVYAALERLYREAARNFEEEGDLRSAAHVFSFLLGRHADAARLLERAGFAQEAATVWYHLEDDPRRAASALENAGAFAEAARLWMDIREWRRAALAWRGAASQEQSDAAWRKLAADLRDAGRALEGAEVLDQELHDPRAALAIVEPIARSLDERGAAALTFAMRLCDELGERDRGVRLVGDASRLRLENASRHPRRHSMRGLFGWIEQTAHDAASRAWDAASATAILEAWRGATKIWCEVRSRFAESVVCEIDLAANSASTRIARLADDPWLSGDVARWLTPSPDENRRDRVPSTSSISERLTGIELSALACATGHLYLGTPGGEIIEFDAELVEIRRLETGGAQPIRCIRSLASDVYASSDRAVHHFAIRGRPGGKLRPEQTERSLPGLVTGIEVFPDGEFVVRRSPRRIDLLHPVHLRPLERIEGDEATLVIDTAIHTRFLAALVRRSSDHEAEPDRHEVRVFRSRKAAARSEFRRVEQFEIRLDAPCGITFARNDQDDIVVWSADWLIHHPPRREDVRIFELEVGTADGRLPPPRVIPIPSLSALLIVYGDGNVERLSLADRTRTPIATPPAGVFDPVIGAERQGPPWVTRIAHRSGRVRTVGDGIQDPPNSLDSGPSPAQNSRNSG